MRFNHHLTYKIVVFSTLLLCLCASNVNSARVVLAKLTDSTHDLSVTLTHTEPTTTTLDIAGTGLADGDYTFRIHEFADLSSTDMGSELFKQAFTWSGSSISTPLTTDPPVLSGASSVLGLSASIYTGETLVLRGVLGFSSVMGNEANTLSAVSTAVCVLQPTSTAPGPISGKALFKENESSTKIIAQVTGLTDLLPHGFHIHQFGNLSQSNGLSSGGHFNPDGFSHAIPGGAGNRHLGDLGNIAFYDNNGEAWYSELLKLPIGNNQTHSILGRALVIHQLTDNGCEQPTGGAGSRYAWCVIGAAKPDLSMPVPPFTIPPQQGSVGCIPSTAPLSPSSKTSSFVWITIVLVLILIGVAGLFAYNWWRKKSEPRQPVSASGRQPWYAQQNEDEDDENSVSLQ